MLSGERLYRFRPKDERTFIILQCSSFVFLQRTDKINHRKQSVDVLASFRCLHAIYRFRDQINYFDAKNIRYFNKATNQNNNSSRGKPSGNRCILWCTDPPGNEVAKVWGVASLTIAWKTIVNLWKHFIQDGKILKIFLIYQPLQRPKCQTKLWKWKNNRNIYLTNIRTKHTMNNYQ